MTRHRLAFILAAIGLANGASAFDDASLQQALNQRLAGDRSGACMAAAVIEQGQVSRALSCADPAQLDRIGFEHSFEIGSVSKTMNAALLAMLVAEGKLDLDDPLTKHLPKGSKAPEFDGQPIRLRHLLTHTSGLPSIAPSWQLSNPANPYSTLKQKDLFSALGKIELATAPGSKFEYSNFGAMLLSWVVSKTADQDYQTLIQQRLFEPLTMQQAYIKKPGKSVPVVQGHTPNRQPTPAWTFPADTAGVGGVRASLNDMIRYLQAHLQPAEDALGQALARTHETLDENPGKGIAWAWMVAPLNDREYLVHEGGTGGFSAFVAFSRDGERGAVVLSDTALTSIGGLSSVGLHLLDPSVPMGKPRLETQPDAELLDALVGSYRLAGGLNMELRRKGDALEIQATGQPAFAMGYDSAGDFYPLAFDALLRPAKRSDGSVGFSWLQGGGVMAAKRIEQVATPPDLSLGDYAGRYPLMPGFELRVFADGEQLKAQATGQGAFVIDYADSDRFVADAYGIEIVFERDTAGAVTALKLHQGGQTMSGKRR
ncbi:serine hydrolase [Pseudomarimonas arenosa]|uniref:Beta-lactamase n=1 Tax=Pseudomarimonas arenosa TaxID=2774145 RepID=A0AAW3ZLH3_9GAMM|nr:serine hydrolase [Pseudomarimonas arenosa]MBD8526891.1 serine hydrolase [Pseudomarimonas arenosa]